ncbi:MAG: surface-adhesin E family protein [Betaproteobacteria bacterium]
MATCAMLIVPTAWLMFAAAPAVADWVKVLETDIVDQYVDPATIHRDGDLRKAWRLQNLKSPTPDGQQSLRLLSEYDCKGGRMRILLGSSYTGPMATGQSLFLGAGVESEWDRVPPDSMGELVLKYVCSQ